MGKSWHVPFIRSYRGPSSQEVLHVVFLQRLSEDERSQIVQNLNEVDRDWASQLDVVVPSPRKLEQVKWIRDYWPSSRVILEIAKDAYSEKRDHERSYSSFIFVDSGWEAGNVIAAHWESHGADMRLNAARVPMEIANLLLTICDTHEGYTLARVLGEELYGETKLGFYSEEPTQGAKGINQPALAYQWPSFLPDGLGLNKTEPIILSMRNLEASDIENLLQSILSGSHSTEQRPDITIHNWQGPRPDRLDMLHMLHCMYDRTAEPDRNMFAFFVDFVLQGKNGEPQIMAATEASCHSGTSSTVEMVPIRTEMFLEFWRVAAAGKGEENLESMGNIWRKETLYDLSARVPIDFDQFDFRAPVIFLQQFTLDQERTIRSNLSELSDTEKGEDWGKDWLYLGYLWPNSNDRHTLEDLRDLFESCDPFSPSFNPKSPGPFQMSNYPHHFIAVDSRALEAEPKVLVVSSLDFSGGDDNVYDQLGWYYGVMNAKEAYVAYVNLNIANMGPQDFFKAEKLWLSDLKEYAEHDYHTED